MTSKGYQFGTFKGVFTPSLLTILGVIMYLRFGWVLANVGLAETLMIVTISTLITFFTGLSISALATNMKIGGGGAYFMISRSLGLEIGAAVGIPLFLAQSIGISFYIAGFSESVANILPSNFLESISSTGYRPETVLGILTLLFLTFLAYISADIALKSQFFIFGLIAASLIAFFLGSNICSPNSADTSGHITTGLPFWYVFAVFFPAATGIEAGLGMSGDLKNPAKSLPLGTLSAIFTSYIIYILIPVFLSIKVHDSNLLLNDPLIMKKVALFGWIIVLALWGASLSSAMGSLLGAPRTLRALSNDKIVPAFIGKSFGRGGDPRIAVCISFLIALCGIIAGNLNFIAPVLSMFFLTSYCLLNASAAFEGLVATPSWRPKFRVHWLISMAGAVMCVFVMLKINSTATIIAAVLSFMIYYLMKRRSLHADWGDVRYGILMLAAKNIIYRLSEKNQDERSWRPNLLVLTGEISKRWYLIELADDISQKRGFLTVAAIVKKDLPNDRIESIRSIIKNNLKERGISAIIKIASAQEISEGIINLINYYGFGPIKPNTILVGETEEEKNFERYSEMVQKICNSNKNLLIVREKDITGGSEMKHDFIDIWWGKSRNNVPLMIAIAQLLRYGEKWKNARLTIKTIVNSEESRSDTISNLTSYVSHARIDATVEVIVNKEGREFMEVIKESSSHANLILIGMKHFEKDDTVKSYSDYYRDFLKKTDEFPMLIGVLASENMDFEKIFKNQILD